MRVTNATRAVDVPVAAVFAAHAAFRDWYELALPRVYRYLYHRCGRNSALAEELTQETFVTALRSSRRYAGRADAVSWVLGIARHRLADYFRGLERDERHRAPGDTEETLAAPLGEPDDELAAALAGLPAGQRAAIVLHYLDDLPVRDVAHLLGRSEKAVESLLSRGRTALRRSYGHGDEELEP